MSWIPNSDFRHFRFSVVFEARRDTSFRYVSYDKIRYIFV